MDQYMKVLRWSLDDTKRRAIVRSRYGRIWRLRALFADHRVWMMGFATLGLLLTVLSFAQLPMSFQPDANMDTSRINIKLAPGAPLGQTEAGAGKWGGGVMD